MLELKYHIGPQNDSEKSFVGTGIFSSRECLCPPTVDKKLTPAEVVEHLEATHRFDKPQERLDLTIDRSGPTAPKGQIYNLERIALRS